jgi:hypothetical protein
MRPSAPVRHFWPLRNHRSFSCFLRSALLVERLGIETRVTPRVRASASFLVEKNPASAAINRGGRTNCRSQEPNSPLDAGGSPCNQRFVQYFLIHSADPTTCSTRAGDERIPRSTWPRASRACAFGVSAQARTTERLARKKVVVRARARHRTVGRPCHRSSRAVQSLTLDPELSGRIWPNNRNIRSQGLGLLNGFVDRTNVVERLFGQVIALTRIDHLEATDSLG